jgi:copper transport protein
MRLGGTVRALAAGLLTGLLVALVGVLASAPASAHAELVRSVPADGANLAAAPHHITIDLSEAVELRASTVTITDAAGHELPVADLHLRRTDTTTTEAPSTLVAAVPPLPKGQYRVSWRTLSSDDLHVTAGVVVFGVQQRVARGATTTGEPRPAPGESALRWLGVLGLGVLLGSVTLGRLVVGRRLSPSLLRRTIHRLAGTAVIGASLCLAAAVALPVTQAARAGGGGTLARLLLHDRYGVRWWAHVTALVVLLGLAVAHHRTLQRDRPGLRLQRLTRWVGPPAVLVAAIALTLMGHLGSTAARHPALVAVGVVHLVSAAVWAGSVVAAAVVLVGTSLEQTWLRTVVLRRFGLVALVSVGAMTASGLLLAGAQVATTGALQHSLYGQALLLKVAVGLVAGLLGLVNTVGVRPALARRLVGRATDPTVLRRTLTAEALVLVTVLAGAAVLASSQPAKGPRWTPRPAPVALRSGSAADLQETLEVKPNRPGQNFVTVQTYDTRRPSPGAVQQVSVTLTSPEHPGTAVAATRLADGSWVVPGYSMTAGTWRVRVDARRPGLPVARASYRWVVPDPSAPPVVGGDSEPLRRWTTPGAIVLGGLLLVGIGVAAGRRATSPRQPVPQSPDGAEQRDVQHA